MKLGVLTLSLTETVPGRPYRPFQYPWCFDYFEQQKKIDWMPSEVAMGDDVKDYHDSLTPGERNLLTQIFRFFVTADQEVGNNYHERYLPIFKPTEVQMMLLQFAATESVHVWAYSHLIDTIGLPETEYLAFLQYKEMTEKYEYFSKFSIDNPHEVAKTLAAFGAFTEGLQLFASFAILLNFPRYNLMKGMGQIISWSVRDESLHCDGVIRLYHTYLDENPSINKAELQKDVEQICRDIVNHEDAFIDLAFGVSEDIRGMTAKDIKDYIRYVANMRLLQLKMEPIYNQMENPIPWLAKQLNSVEHANFFDARVTTYSRSATTGSWEEVFDD
jgi:ribonucleoside-diphosphate reductase beta chain